MVLCNKPVNYSKLQDDIDDSDFEPQFTDYSSSCAEESDYSEDDKKNEKPLQLKASTLNPTKSNQAIHHASSNKTKSVISKGNFKHLT